MERIILHCDLNNFYASVECFYNPSLRNKPVAVCGSKKDRHGIVLAKNYIAKKYKIRTGEATWEAKNKCPNLIIVPPNFELYLKMSKIVRNILKEYSDQIEAFGIDENWIDITNISNISKNSLGTTRLIQKRITEETGLTTSIGLSFNKIFAKLGSDSAGRNCIEEISISDFRRKVWPLPISDLLYVGRSTRKKFYNMGVLTIGKLANLPIEFLKEKFGKWGETLWIFANGYDKSPVAQVDDNPIIKGIGNSLTSPKDLLNDEDVKVLIHLLSESISKRLRANNFKGKCIQLWIKDKNLKSIERQSQLFEHTFLSSIIAEKAFEIFKKNWYWYENIRALGIRVTNLIPSNKFIQLSMLNNRERKRELIDICIDELKEKYGNEKFHKAIVLKDKNLSSNPLDANKIHPVSYFK
jgi:DNA polymerase IV